jgi:WD40 repeat protein
VNAVAFSTDGRHVVTGSGDKTAVLWDGVRGQKVRTFEGHTGWVQAVALSPDGKHLVTGSQDRTAALWEVATGRRACSFTGHTNNVLAVSFSPDGKQVLTGALDHTAALWEADTGRRLRSFAGHSGAVRAVTFSVDGKHVITGSEDNTAILWEADTGRKLQELTGHTASVTAVRFSTANRYIVTASGDGTMRLWEIATGDELARLVSLDGGKYWLVVTPEGLFEGSEGGRQQVAFRVGGGLRVVPVDRFFQGLHYPGLLDELLHGKRPLPARELALQLPPVLRITSPTGGVALEAQVTVEVEATDNGGGVSGPWLMHNGARVIAPSTSERTGKVTRQRFTVSLVQGNNHVEVRAASADGSWESEPDRLILRYEKLLERPQLHIVAAGISKYADDGLSLKFAAADARAVADLFQRRGKGRKGLYRDVQAQVLLDGDATAAGVRRAFAQVKEKARPQDTLLVFLAGHGTMIGQRYYFIPHEFKRSDAGMEDDVRRQCLSHDALGDLIEAVPALKRVVIFDTCASGGAVGLARTTRDPFVLQGAVERLGRNRGVFAIAAAASMEEAQEVKELGHGVLSYALLAGLNAVDRGPLQEEWVRPGGDEGVVDVLEWFAFAAGHVPRLTKELCGQEQNVHTAGRGGNFPVLPLEGP